MYEGMIREKPSSTEEARLFIKGIIINNVFCVNPSFVYSINFSLTVLHIRIGGYSGGHAATVSSVLVTNLSTGLRKGGWDKVEVILFTQY